MAKEKTCFQLSFLIFLYLFSKFVSLEATKLSPNSSISNAEGCIELERKALLRFKQGLKDPSGRLSSWVGKDCCGWSGVGCSEQTGHVIKLHLRNPHNSTFLDPGDSTELADYKFSCLSGKISLSLLELKYLNHLDLSWNDFEGEPIPESIGSLNELSYLDLSSASFSGLVPPHLGNLSNLRYLNLYSDSYQASVTDNTFVSDLNWITRLSHLEYLNLGYVNLSFASDTWVQVANMLPSLSQLHLLNCGLRNFPDSLPTMNLSALRILRLGDNNFNNFLPHWLSNISTLEVLELGNSGIKGPIDHISWIKLCNLQLLSLSNNDISGEIVELVEGLSECSNTTLEALQLVGNKLSGQIPESIGHFKFLRSLYLESNSFSGSIPSSIGRLTVLETLDLSSNAMNGTIPDSIGQLSKLVSLDLKWNSWRGILSETHFLSLAKLERFRVSSVRMSLAIKIGNEWVPPFSLQDIEIVDCHLGSTFPQWISTQKDLSSLTLKNAAISGKIPNWLGKLSPQLFWLDLSGNQFGGEIPSSLEFRSSAWIDLSSNFLEGSLPIWYNVSVLILKSNLLSGPITLIFCQEMSSLTDLDLSGNSLNGSIPPFITTLKNLETLVLSNNLLSGNIDFPWNEMSLSLIDLSRNNLSGDIPDSICFSPTLQVLKFFRNNFSGELSPSLQNCTGLMLLDLGENRFSGSIPKWVWYKLSRLSALGLRGNMFSGNIPEQLCRLPYLHILDLAHNHLSGFLPPCLGNLSGFRSPSFYEPDPSDFFVTYRESMDLTVKGRQLEYNLTLGIVNVLDLSRNNLKGEIPEEIANLTYLGTMNLSGNQLTGKIPDKIGSLHLLETLDLSNNHLSGLIPPSMSSMTFLNHLNLSYNNLSGPIPSTNQFQTFNDPSIYEGNSQLCGSPLPTKCSTPVNEASEFKDDEVDDEDDGQMLWFYLGMAAGFAVGFWVVCGTLITKKSWRRAYFQFIEEMKEKIYVAIAVNVARLRRSNTR